MRCCGSHHQCALETPRDKKVVLKRSCYPSTTLFWAIALLKTAAFVNGCHGRSVKRRLDGAHNQSFTVGLASQQVKLLTVNQATLPFP